MEIHRGSSDTQIYQFHSSYQTPLADATSYYVGGSVFSITTASFSGIDFLKAGTVTSINLKMYVWYGGSNETSTISFRLNDSSNTTISSAVDCDDAWTLQDFTITPNIAVVAGDYFEILWVTPTWATNPDGALIWGTVLVE